jgi:hypothetical protein
LRKNSAVVDVNVEAEEVPERDVVEAPAVVACGASGAFRMTPPLGKTKAANAVKTAKMARGLIFATETFWLMVKQQRTTLLPQLLPRRA